MRIEDTIKESLGVLKNLENHIKELMPRSNKGVSDYTMVGEIRDEILAMQGSKTKSSSVFDEVVKHYQNLMQGSKEKERVDKDPTA